MRRFLGAAWAMVHGPREPRALLVWALERGFEGLGVGPGPRAFSWSALHAGAAELPVSFPAVRVRGILDVPAPGEPSLASNHAGERETARARVRDAVELAVRLGIRTVVLDPGTARAPGEPPDDPGDPAVRWTEDRAKAELARRAAVLDQALDRACRSLWHLCKAFPDMRFCLGPSRHAHGLGDPLGLGHVFDDLESTCRLGYWHDTALAARREELFGTPQGGWLETFGNRLAGITLGDSSGGTLYLPPGSGGVDYPMLAAYRRRSGQPLPAVLELDPQVEAGELPGAHAFLDKYGL